MSFGVACQIQVELYMEQLLFLLKGEYPIKDRLNLRLSEVIKVTDLYFFLFWINLDFYEINMTTVCFI